VDCHQQYLKQSGFPLTPVHAYRKRSADCVSVEPAITTTRKTIVNKWRWATKLSLMIQSSTPWLCSWGPSSAFGVDCSTQNSSSPWATSSGGMIAVGSGCNSEISLFRPKNASRIHSWTTAAETVISITVYFVESNTLEYSSAPRPSINDDSNGRPHRWDISGRRFLPSFRCFTRLQGCLGESVRLRSMAACE